MGFILFIHVTVCVLLVISILMQAGRGGGLAESFASAESMFGTQTNAFMVRVSTVLALIFLVTSLVLAFNASKKERSLMTNDRLLPKAQETKQPAVTITPVTPTPATTTAPDSAPKP
ncbi:MAG TPA: preprotein translocase subunit SecG [Candidatus Omnitrophota bacterium]|nr:preprotein translocase subunit SecG [Candidatus Omnitrophota bacterium]